MAKKKKYEPENKTVSTVLGKKTRKALEARAKADKRKVAGWLRLLIERELGIES